MDKKIVTLILVMLISFCLLTVVVAENVAHNDNNTADHNKTIDKDKKVDKNSPVAEATIRTMTAGMMK